jgi:hypothetical protein
VSERPPTFRLRVIALLWGLLAILPLAVGLTVKMVTVRVAAAIAIRAVLGGYAWRKASILRDSPSARRGRARVIQLLAPIAIITLGLLDERRSPPPVSMFTPEWVLPRRGTTVERPWYRDSANPPFAMCGLFALEALLGLTVTFAHKRPRE